MKKILKNIFVIMITFIICYMCLGISNNVYAASVGVSSSSVTVGNTTTITVSIPSGYVAYEGTVSFDSSKLSYVSSSSGNLVGGVVKVADANTKLEQVSNFSVTFKGNSAGSANVSVNLTLSNSDASSTPTASGSGTVTVKAVEQPATPPSTPPTNAGSSSDSGSTTTTPNSGSSTTTTQTPKEPNFTQTNETVYAKKSMNVRSSWSTSSSKIGGLAEGQAVTRTGIGDNGWSRISYNGGTAYVSTALITTTKPEPVEAEKPEEEPEETTTEENPEEINEEEIQEEVPEEVAEKTEEQIYQEIVSKVGTIPEVGTNKNIYIYYALMLISSIAVIIVLKK